MFALRHIPALAIATALTFGGMIPFYNPAGAISEFGLPDHIASSPPAQVIMTVNGARNTVLGLAIWSLYLQRMLSAVDTVLCCVAVLGLFDGYICWGEDVRRTAVLRAAAGVLIGLWGGFGLTAGS